MTSHRGLLLGVLLIATALLAWLFKPLIGEMILLPLAELFWRFQLSLSAVPENVFWALLIACVVLISLIGLLSCLRFTARSTIMIPVHLGPVESLARDLQNLERGPYFQWVVANRLGELAQSILALREQNTEFRPRSMRRGFQNSEWRVPLDIQAYLEAGLDRSLSQPSRRRLFLRKPEPPFAINLNQVIEFLENQMERHNER